MPLETLWPAPASPTDHISPNFTVGEFAHSDGHPELVAQVPKMLYPNLLALTMWGAEPLRAALGTPLRVLSGFRSAALNSAVGGSATSQHLRAEAMDLAPADPKNYTDMLAAMMELVQKRTVLGLGQIICYPSRGFLHVALRGNRYPFPMVHVHEPSLGLHYSLLKDFTMLALQQALDSAKTFTGGQTRGSRQAE